MKVKITIFERAPGVWRVRDETNGKNNGTSETVYGTRDDATRKVIEIEQARYNGTYARPNRITLAEHWPLYIAQRVANGLSEESAETYTGQMERHVLPKLGACKLQEIEGFQIQAIYADLQKSHAPATVQQVHAILSAMFRLARKQRHIGANPLDTVDVPKARERAMSRDELDAKVLEPEQLEHLLNSLADYKHGDVVRFAIAMGVRLSEAFGARWRALELDGPTPQFEVRGQLKYKDGAFYFKSSGKSKHSIRSIGLPAELADTLRKLRAEAMMTSLAAGVPFDRDGYVFGGGTTIPANVSQDFTRHLERIGLRPKWTGEGRRPPGFSFHSLRHTYATLLLRRGENITELSKSLGHAKASFTIDRYCHATRGVSASLTTAAGQLLKGSKSTEKVLPIGNTKRSG